METSNIFEKNENAGWLNFPAIRGVQAGREYYTAMVPFKHIPRIFVFDEYEIPPEMRAQRKLNTARIPKLVEYVVDNTDNYIFSALTASIDGEMRFLESEKQSSIGELYISLNATLVINDGQHRRAAIDEVLKLKPELAFESIPVVFFVDLGLKKSQQMFADLNKNAVRPSRSLNILYNVRDENAQKIMGIIDGVKIFKGNVELEKTSISKRSTKIFTLSSLYDACNYVYQDVTNEKEMNRRTKLLIDYWNTLSEVILPWKRVFEGSIQTWQFREDFVCAHGILLESFGLLGRYLFENYPKNWKEKLTGLKDVEWFRNKDWEGVAMHNGRMVKSQDNILNSMNKIKEELGL